MDKKMRNILDTKWGCVYSWQIIKPDYRFIERRKRCDRRKLI